MDGVRYETEGVGVFSTGTWRPEDGITPGNGRGEYLAIPMGSFSSLLAATVGGATINVYATGSTGSEQAQLLIDGQVAQTFNDISTGGQTLTYQHSSNVSPDQVRVAFTNDFFGNGIDRNLTVDRIEIEERHFKPKLHRCSAMGST